MRSASKTDRRLMALVVASLLVSGLLHPAGAAPTGDAMPDPPPADAEARSLAIKREYTRLRRRRLDDLAHLVSIEPDPFEKAQVMLALNRARRDEARAIGLDLVPDLDPDVAGEAAQRYEDQASMGLELLWERRAGLPPALVDEVGLLLAEGLWNQREREPDLAVGVLRAVNETSADPERRARAGQLLGHILGQAVGEEHAREAYRVHARAFADAPTADRRVDLLHAALRIGRIDEAIAHCAAIVRQPVDPGDHGAAARREDIAGRLGVLLARQFEPERARAYIEGLGEGGRWVWLRFGLAFSGRGRFEAMRDALERARRVDPRPLGRFRAVAGLLDASDALGRRDEAAGFAAALDRALDALPADAPDRSRWLHVAERSLYQAIDLMSHQPDAWRPDEARIVLDAYLDHFAESPDAQLAFYVRGALLAGRATTCAERREAAADLRRAHDNARAVGADAAEFAVTAGVALMRTLAACRPTWNAERPAVAEFDAALVSFGRRFLADDVPPAAAGEVLDLLALAHLAAGEDAEARAALERAVTLDGDHLSGAAGHLLIALELAGDLDAYADRADAFAADARLADDEREAMAQRARAARYTAAVGDPDPAERARRLMAFVARHPDTAEVGDALRAAASAYTELGDARLARAALEDAVARELAGGGPGPAHVDLAALLERQGRFREAAEHIERWVEGPGTAEPARVEAIRARLAELWSALDEPIRARRAVAGEGGASRTALIDGMIDALERGQVDRAGRLLAAVEPSGSHERALVADAKRCLERSEDAVRRLSERRRDARADRLLGACLAHDAEALLTARPAADTPPGEAFAVIDRRLARAEALLGTLDGARLPPTIVAGVELRLLLVFARLHAEYAGWALRGWTALTEAERAEVTAMIAGAWTVWHRVAAALDGRPADVYSARLGAALAELAAIEMPTGGEAP